ncbi:DUF6894 family protein [Bosea sp. TAF32]|uniref:DUF6894 family protein n=1 Tax=Bosea sp. TAF32 TaxID=3237482 RepID=UPI003F91C3C2
MAMFYIDTSDGDKVIVDDEGMELADESAARFAALAALPDMAKDKVPNGDERRFVVRVRNAAGVPVYAATLSLKGGWCSAGEDSVEADFGS